MTDLWAGIKPCVTFIYVRDDSGDWKPNGTGFFAGVPDQNRQINCCNLVTARHVICDQAGRLRESFAIRMNKRGGGTALFELPLRGADKAQMFEHPDSTVDLAVFPAPQGHHQLEHYTIPEWMILWGVGAVQRGFYEGLEVGVCGLFLPFPGSTRNFPMVKFGRVAMVPQDRIPTKQGGAERDLFLIQCESLGGYSGSPVFLIPDPHDHEAGHSMLLAGIVVGGFTEQTDILLSPQPDWPKSVDNTNISGVVPSRYLVEILHDACRPDTVESGKVASTT